MPSVLITGANRGLGLEFCRQYAESGYRVFATCRNPEAATELQKLASDSVTMHRLDVADDASIQSLAKELAQEAIDLLLNNAGIYGPKRQRFSDLDYAGISHTFKVNAIAPLQICEAFFEQVRRSERKLMVAITSGMGSIEDNTSGGYYAYRMSKTALNMAFHTLALDLKHQGITAVVINPGWVKTDMGGEGATMEPADSIARMRAIFDRLTLEDSGKFLNYASGTYPW